MYQTSTYLKTKCKILLYHLRPSVLVCNPFEYMSNTLIRSIYLRPKWDEFLSLNSSLLINKIIMWYFQKCKFFERLMETHCFRYYYQLKTVFESQVRHYFRVSNESPSSRFKWDSVFESQMRHSIYESQIVRRLNFIYHEQLGNSYVR